MSYMRIVLCSFFCASILMFYTEQSNARGFGTSSSSYKYNYNKLYNYNRGKTSNFYTREGKNNKLNKALEGLLQLQRQYSYDGIKGLNILEPNELFGDKNEIALERWQALIEIITKNSNDRHIGNEASFEKFFLYQYLRNKDFIEALENRSATEKKVRRSNLRLLVEQHSSVPIESDSKIASMFVLD